MAKHPLDKIFREKLVIHEVQPRKEAWEKLEFLLDENQENKQKRKGGFLWVSIAAAFALFVLSFGVWQALQEPKKDISKNDTLKFDLKQDKKNLSQENNNRNTKTQELDTSNAKKQTIDDLLGKDLKEKNQISIQETKEKSIQILPKNPKKLEETPKIETEKEKLDTQVADNQKTVIPENEDEKTFKVVVKVKLAPVAKTSATETKETLVAENGKRRGKKLDKVLQSVQDLKNQDTDLYTVLGLAKDKGN